MFACADSQQELPAGWRLLNLLCGLLHSVYFSCFNPAGRSKGMHFTPLFLAMELPWYTLFWICRVCYRHVSQLQSYASSVSQSYETCTIQNELVAKALQVQSLQTHAVIARNMLKLLMMLFFCCSIRYHTGYVTRYQTMYSSLFACCSGYIKMSTCTMLT